MQRSKDALSQILVVANNRAESESQKQTSAEAKDGLRQSHLCGRNVEPRAQPRSRCARYVEIRTVDYGDNLPPSVTFLAFQKR